MHDFTLSIYKNLLESLQKDGYQFYTFEMICEGVSYNNKSIVLRHDIDLKAEQALKVALIESQLGIRASYYFRIIPQSNQPQIIRKIVELGHEIGYHYENLTTSKGNFLSAFITFKSDLEYFRTFYPVKTICMHGSPRSKYDSRNLWNNYNYKELGILGEPYFDIDFNEMFYLTDTGRCWDGDKYSIRDKVDSNIKLRFHSTKQILRAAQNATLPPKIMITTHPQRWTNNPIEWIVELITQKTKNLIKKQLVRKYM